MQEFLDTCQSREFAGMAFYSVPNRGSGPSIRFAEEAARCYGNFQYGHRELSRSEGKSEIEVYAWDMQNNNFRKRQITVLHVVDTKNGPKKLIDQADIDNRIANVASKQMRSCILALLPKHLVAAGQEACKRTLAGGGEKPIRERIAAMVQAFAKFGVTPTHLGEHLGHGVDDTTVDELAELMGIFNAIKEGAKPSEYFRLEQTQAQPSATAQAVANRASAPTPPAPAAPAQAPAAEPPAAAPAPRQPRRNAAQSDGNTVKEQAAESAQTPPPAEPAPPAPAPAPAPAASSAADDDVF